MLGETGYTGLVGAIRDAVSRVVVGACVLFGVVAATTSQGYAQSSATVGGVRGVVRDKATKEPAAGATVVATSPSLVGEQTAITDETGQYFISALPPGVYTLTIYFGRTFTRGGVLVRVGKEAVVNLDVTSDGATGETIEIAGSVPLVDQGSTKTGVTVTGDYTRNIPTGRTFGDVLGAAAGSQEDARGWSFNGTTSPENVFIIDGLDTTDTGVGGISTNLPNEFIDETEVVTGGYNAEFGRATGGIINVVTKQGSNRFGGSVFAYYRPGTFVADAQPIRRNGSSIDSKTDLDHEYDLGAEVGGPIVKDRLWFHAGINPSISRTTLTRIVTSRLDNNGDGGADLDETTGFELRDEVARSTDSQTMSTYFFTAKVNGAVDENHQFQIATIGNPRTGSSFLGINRNPETIRIGSDDGSIDVSAKWTSKLSRGKTQLDAVVGYHRSYSSLEPLTAAGQAATVRFNYPDARSLYDFASLERGDLSRCEDGGPNDAFPMIVNCPVTQYTAQGTGLIGDEVRDRTQVVITATQRVHALGHHTFRAGLDLGFAGYAQTLGFTGGFQVIRRRANDPNGRTQRWELQELYEYQRDLLPGEAPALEEEQLLCAGERALCERVSDATTTTSNATYAAYVQDSWQLRPNLTINAGLRWEQQTGGVAHEAEGRLTPDGERIPKNAYELTNLLAPRFGVIFDPTQEGKAKLFGHWGRYFENVPMDLNVRGFGNGVVSSTLVNFTRPTPDQGTYDPSCDVDITNQPPGTDLAAAIAQCRDRRLLAIFGDGLANVSRGLRGQYTDELVFGAEYELVPDLKVGASYIRRRLPRVIEDVSIDGGNTYLITNPGEDFGQEAAELRERAAMVRAAGDDALADLLDDRADTLDHVKLFDKPVRDYDAVQLTAQQRPTRRSLLQASYTYSRLRGNFSGSLATDTGQLDPNITAVYDLPDMMANRFGAMKLDRPHNLKIDGFYLFELSKRSRLVTGASFRAQSGVAHTTLGVHTTYGTGESFLLPRGVFGRSPTTTQTDLHVSYGHQLSRTLLLEGFVRVFNVLDQQAELDADDIYTLDPAMPIVGGDREDLRHLKALDPDLGTESARTVTRYKNFQATESRQDPRSVQLGLRLTF